MNKKKVLFLVSSLNFGGAQKVVSNITTTLPEKYEIDILLNSDKDVQYPYRGRLFSLNVKEPKSREGIFYQFKVFCKRLYTIKKLKKKNHYDAVVSILTSANVANVLCKTPGCRSIITEVIMPNDNPSFKEKYIIGGLTTLFYDRADCIVAETKVMAENLIKNHKVSPDRIVLIPNSISVEGINKQAAKALSSDESQIFNQQKTFVTAGRMQYQKAHWHLIRAFSKVVKNDDSAKLVIFGEGELFGMLKELVKAYHLENNIYLKGFTSELDKYVAKCRAFVFPSMFEGMPTALLQAMAVGVPCIVTDFYSGAREVLGDDQTPAEHFSNVLFTEWGIMCPMFSGEYHSADKPLEQSEEIFADVMIRMLDDNELRKRYSEAAKRRSMFFDNENIIKKWMEVI